MKLIIAQIAQLLADLIKSWYNKFKLKKLKDAANVAKEKSDESTKYTTDAYSAFMRDYDNFTVEWRQRSNADLSDLTTDVQKPSGAATTNSTRPGRNNRKAGKPNKRAGKPNKRSKAKRKKR